MSLFLVAFVLCSGLCASAKSKAIEVDIAVLGGNLPNVIISLAYHGPVIDLAVAEANVALAGKVNLNLKYVSNELVIYAGDAYKIWGLVFLLPLTH